MRTPRLSLSSLPAWAGPFALCLGIAAISSVKPISDLSLSLGDTDDAMRLTEARALLDGRGWYDLVEPRLNPPEGLHSHWSRLVDGPIAALVALGRALFGPSGGDTLARIAWPLLLFAGTAFVLIRVAQTLGEGAAGWAAAMLIATCWLLWMQFTPGNLDHHGIELLLMAGMMLCALDFTGKGRAALMGVLAGVALAIAYESLPIIVWSGGLAVYYFVFAWNGVRAARMFGLALTASTALCFIVQTPPSWWTNSACDALALNGVGAALIAGLGLAAATKWAAASGKRRVISSLAIGAAAALAFIAPHPSCLHGPYGDLDPRLVPLWLNNVGEAQPLLARLGPEPVLTISAALLPLGALVAALVLIVRGERRAGFRTLTALLALTSAIGIIQVRGFVLASAAAIPLAAMMLARIRFATTLQPATIGIALGLLVSPLVTQLALGAALPPPVRANEAKATFNQAACFTNEAFADLRDLPPGVVLADLDAGPHIIAQTWHSAVAAPYQRIDKAMLKSLLVFGQPPREAADIVRETGATYIALCKTGVFAANARPNTLAEHLASGHPPSWATMLPASKGDYFLFRVERNRLPSTDEIRGREEI